MLEKIFHFSKSEQNGAYTKAGDDWFPVNDSNLRVWWYPTINSAMIFQLLL